MLHLVLSPLRLFWKLYRNGPIEERSPMRVSRARDEVTDRRYDRVADPSVGSITGCAVVFRLILSGKCIYQKNLESKALLQGRAATSKEESSVLV